MLTFEGKIGSEFRISRLHINASRVCVLQTGSSRTGQSEAFLRSPPIHIRSNASKQTLSSVNLKKTAVECIINITAMVWKEFHGALRVISAFLSALYFFFLVCLFPF